MASLCNQKAFLKHTFSLWLLLHVLIKMWCFPVIESAAPLQVRGEVGGSVSIRCPVEQRPIYFFYLQKGLSFVNGYYQSKNITNKWENTRLDRDKTTVSIGNLNVSHEGNYTCLHKYRESNVVQTVIHLSVTANYSIPAVKVLRKDERHWLVMCSTHGGYPESKIMWNVTGSQMVKVVNSSKMTDPVTLTLNSSSTALLNCSSGGMSLSCSIGDVTSQSFSVCEYPPKGTPKDPSDTSVNAYVAAVAIVVIVPCCIITLVYLRRKSKKRQTDAGAAPAGMRLEEVNEIKEQEKALTKDEEAA